MTQVVRRLTKYTNDVLVILKNKHHATNSDIAQVLRDTYSDVSDTTVHRVTQRLHGDGLIGLAPPTKRGCLRYDACVDLHDHFLCDNKMLKHDCFNLFLFAPYFIFQGVFCRPFAFT